MKLLRIELKKRKKECYLILIGRNQEWGYVNSSKMLRVGKRKFKAFF